MMEILMTHRDEYRVVPVSVKCYDLTYWGLLQFVRLHNHDSLEIIVMREGTMDVHLGEEVVRLTAKGWRLDRTADKLYDEVGDAALVPQEIKLIPYFEWDNAGFQEMRIWIPVRYDVK